VLLSHPVGITLLKTRAPSFIFATTSIELGANEVCSAAPCANPNAGSSVYPPDLPPKEVHPFGMDSSKQEIVRN